MSTNLQFRLTSAGQQAAWNASNTGISLNLTHVQFGSGNRTPTGTETALVTPQTYVAFAAGSRVTPNQIRLSALLTGAASFNIGEIGIWKGVPGQAGSVLFAYWSQASGVLGAKAPGVDFIFTHDMVLSDAVAAGAVTVVADTSQSAMLAMLAEHEAKPDPHVGYMLESVFELTTVPTNKIAPIIFVTQPYFRMMVWDGSQYVRAPIVSPNLTGVPTAPTAAPGTNTKQIANTEFVQAALGDAISAGAVLGFAMAAAPTGWLKCNGAAVSRTAYANLFAAIGTTYGAGNGSTTFNVPELRGEFIRGWPDGRDVDAGRAFGSWQSDSIKSHSHSVPYRKLKVSNTSYGDVMMVGNTDSVETSVSGGTETNPRNVAMLYCIKY